MPEQDKRTFTLKRELVEFYLQHLEQDTDVINALKNLANTAEPTQEESKRSLAEKLYVEIRSDFLKQMDFCYEIGAQTPNRIVGFSNDLVEEFLEMGIMWMMSAKQISLQGIRVVDAEVNAIRHQAVELSRMDSQIPDFET